ncbi:MAG TPA: hypothetical protein VG895_04680 [Patescibacteria group bacterium]|nr:hypothetical protein [Patescibacteria group bacterium]
MPEVVTTVQQNVPEKDLIVWSAPSRPFKRRNREFYINIIAIAAVTGLVAFLIDGFLPVILIISIVFLVYVMSTIEPENIEYKITNKGIKIAGRLTDWNIMNRFWFAKRLDNELLIIETRVLPGRLELVTKPELKDQIQKALSEYLVHEEVPASGLDRATNWFSNKMPGLK